MGEPDPQIASGAEQLLTVGGFSVPEQSSSGALERLPKNWHSTPRTDTP